MIADRAVAVLALLGAWLAWLQVRLTVAPLPEGESLPSVTSAWLGYAGSAASLAWPVVATVLLAVAWGRRSARLGAAAALVLFVSLLHLAVGQWALALPGMSLCGCIR